MTSDWVGHDANNGNLLNRPGVLIQLNDIGSASAPTYDWYILSMLNNGTIQWCGRGDTGGSTYQMYNDLDGVNNGLISFEQTTRNLGASFVWRNPTLTTAGTQGYNIYNNGAFRLINVVFHNVQNIYGNGCWQISSGGVLYLEDGTGVYQNPNNGPSFPGQSIIFTNPNATLHMDTAVYSLNSQFGAKVYGFGLGNAIEFYQTIQNYSYSKTTGVLNVQFVGGYQANINLGLSYDPTLFVQKNNPQPYNIAGYNAIFYNGPAPSQVAPSQCTITVPVCSNLSSGPPQPSTSSSSSSSAATTSRTSSATSTTTRVSVTTSSPSTCGTPTNLSTPYQPYYPAIATGYVTVPAAGSVTTTAGQPCPTMPEAGTYCGFINPLDPCAPQPDGYGPVPTPDTPQAFLADPVFHALAKQAPDVINSTTCGYHYVQIWADEQASAAADDYITMNTFKTDDPLRCAAACDQTSGCMSFNVYVERDPSVNPADNDSSMPSVWGYDCPDPPSMTTFRCTLWGSALTTQDATNIGSWRHAFEVVVAGSDGYVKQPIAS